MFPKPYQMLLDIKENDHWVYNVAVVIVTVTERFGWSAREHH